MEFMEFMEGETEGATPAYHHERPLRDHPVTGEDKEQPGSHVAE